MMPCAPPLPAALCLALPAPGDEHRPTEQEEYVQLSREPRTIQPPPTNKHHREPSPAPAPASALAQPFVSRPPARSSWCALSSLILDDSEDPQGADHAGRSYHDAAPRCGAPEPLISFAHLGAPSFAAPPGQPSSDVAAAQKDLPDDESMFHTPPDAPWPPDPLAAAEAAWEASVVELIGTAVPVTAPPARVAADVNADAAPDPATELGCDGAAFARFSAEQRYVTRSTDAHGSEQEVDILEQFSVEVCGDAGGGIYDPFQRLFDPCDAGGWDACVVREEVLQVQVHSSSVSLSPSGHREGRCGGRRTAAKRPRAPVRRASSAEQRVCTPAPGSPQLPAVQDVDCYVAHLSALLNGCAEAAAAPQAQDESASLACRPEPQLVAFQTRGQRMVLRALAHPACSVPRAEEAEDRVGMLESGMMQLLAINEALRHQVECSA